MLSNLLFCISMVFFIYGLWNIVMKIGFFNGLIYGSRSLVDIVKSKVNNSEYLKDDYVNFIVKNHKKEYNILMPIIIGAILLGLSILTSILI